MPPTNKRKHTLLPRPIPNVDQLITMHASLIRRQLGGLIPPKIATPKLVVSLIARNDGSRAYSKFAHFRSLEDPEQVWDPLLNFTQNFPREMLPLVSVDLKAASSMERTRQGHLLLG